MWFLPKKTFVDEKTDVVQQYTFETLEQYLDEFGIGRKYTISQNTHCCVLDPLKIEIVYHESTNLELLLCDANGNKIIGDMNHYAHFCHNDRDSHNAACHAKKDVDSGVIVLANITMTPPYRNPYMIQPNVILKNLDGMILNGGSSDFGESWSGPKPLSLPVNKNPSLIQQMAQIDSEIPVAKINSLDVFNRIYPSELVCGKKN